VDNFDKRQVVVAELLRDAGRSDRLIAEKLGGAVSSGLVRKVRQKLEQEGKVQPAGKRIGKDGRRRGPRRNLKAAKQLEKHLAALEGEKVFASEQPLPPPDDQPVPSTDDEFVKLGLIAGMVVMQGYTEDEARKEAEELLGDLKEETDRQQLIEMGKEYLARRRAGTLMNFDGQDR
jgi:hypothetical protein